MLRHRPFIVFHCGVAVQTNIRCVWWHTGCVRFLFIFRACFVIRYFPTDFSTCEPSSDVSLIYQYESEYNTVHCSIIEVCLGHSAVFWLRCLFTSQRWLWMFSQICYLGLLLYQKPPKNNVSLFDLPWILLSWLWFLIPHVHMFSRVCASSALNIMMDVTFFFFFFTYGI